MADLLTKQSKLKVHLFQSFQPYISWVEIVVSTVGRDWTVKLKYQLMSGVDI